MEINKPYSVVESLSDETARLMVSVLPPNNFKAKAMYRHRFDDDKDAQIIRLPIHDDPGLHHNDVPTDLELDVDKEGSGVIVEVVIISESAGSGSPNSGTKNSYD